MTLASFILVPLSVPVAFQALLLGQYCQTSIQVLKMTKMLVKKMAFVSIMAIVLMLMASAAFGAGLTINGTVQMESLTIGSSNDDIVTMAGASTLRINGTGNAFVNDSTAADGLIHSGNDTVELNGSSDGTIGGTATTTFKNLTFSGTGGRTFNANVTINNAWNTGGLNVTISGAKTVTLGASNVTTVTAGTLTETGTLSCNAASEVIYANTGALQAWALNGSYGKFTHNGSGTLSLGANLTCAGLLTNTQGEFTPAGYSITAPGLTWTAGNITATPSGAWDIGTSGVSIGSGSGFVATSSAFNCEGAWSMASSTFTHSNGTVIFDGNGAITSNSNSFYNVTITAASTLSDAMTLAGNLLIDGASGNLGCTNKNLTVTGNSTISNGGTVTITTATYDCDGTFNATGGNITFTDAGSLLLGGATITNLGTLSINNGTVNYNREGAQAVLSNAYYNLTVSGSGAKTLNDTGLIVNGNFSVEGSSIFDKTGTLDITIGGNLTIANGAGWTKGSGTTTFNGSNCQLTDNNTTPVDLGKIAVD